MFSRLDLRRARDIKSYQVNPIPEGNIVLLILLYRCNSSMKIDKLKKLKSGNAEPNAR